MWRPERATPGSSADAVRPALAHMWHAKGSRGAASRGAAGSHRKILIVNGHPDPRPERFCAALCEAHAEGARAGGWQARQLNVGSVAPDLMPVLESMHWSEALTIVFPLWLDRPPEPLRRLFDQVAQLDAAENTRPGSHARPARIFVTMEMPAFAQRAICRQEAPHRTHAFSLADIASGEPTFIGSVDSISVDQRAQWLRRLYEAGMRGPRF
ncbi:MAG TPA: NAD(P)H-dependent oxidoreductase [Rhizomicrobium sp.]|nr:NAD(P)H-dependent oxidoreductase [Rhizomicrobium sp.]